jgi:hypothetical protein
MKYLPTYSHPYRLSNLSFHLRLSFTFFLRFYPAVWQDRGSFASPESLHIWPCPGTLNRLHSSIPASPPPTSPTPLPPLSHLSHLSCPPEVVQEHSSSYPPASFSFSLSYESEHTKERFWEIRQKKCRWRCNFWTSSKQKT